MSKRIPRLDKSSYGDVEAYYRDVHAGGGPDFDDIDSVRSAPGEIGEILRGIWGRTEADYEKALAYEIVEEQKRYPHLFIRKWRG